MYADLPEQIKQVVKACLLEDDFPAAKRIHDDWMANHHCANEHLINSPSPLSLGGP